EDTHIIPCCYARDMMKHVANLKACISIYPYLNQPFRCLQWGSCIAGYYHLMPTASSMQALII
ncbi:MAG: hypothetical protein II576_03600, partial [Prevotella sp.]|nr:hypothetical protein [Prevotella sp.]